jgi:hypothetical protein
MVMIVYLDKIYTTKTTTSGWGAIMVMIVYLDKIYTTKTTTSGWGAVMVMIESWPWRPLSH